MGSKSYNGSKKDRQDLKMVLGENIVRFGVLEGVNVEVYSEKVLP